MGPEPPPSFLCPLSRELMADPVMLVETGMTYNRPSIEAWFKAGNSTCPTTTQQVHSKQLVPNWSLKLAIQSWAAANGISLGAAAGHPAQFQAPVAHSPSLPPQVARRSMDNKQRQPSVPSNLRGSGQSGSMPQFPRQQYREDSSAAAAPSWGNGASHPSQSHPASGHPSFQQPQAAAGQQDDQPGSPGKVARSVSDMWALLHAPKQDMLPVVSEDAPIEPEPEAGSQGLTGRTASDIWAMLHPETATPAAGFGGGPQLSDIIEEDDGSSYTAAGPAGAGPSGTSEGAVARSVSDMWALLHPPSGASEPSAMGLSRMSIEEGAGHSGGGQAVSPFAAVQQQQAQPMSLAGSTSDGPPSNSSLSSTDPHSNRSMTSEHPHSGSATGTNESWIRANGGAVAGRSGSNDAAVRARSSGSDQRADSLRLPEVMGTGTWQIPEEELEICHDENGEEVVLGKGAFGKVYKAMMDGVELVAMKLVVGSIGENSKAQEEALHEVAILRECRNPHVVMFLGASIFQGQIALVTELMEGGNLFHAIRTEKVKCDGLGIKIAADIARGLSFLHSRKIVHLDLKSPNILLTRDFTAKIADVGLSKVMKKQFLTAVSAMGTFAWAAPELLMGGQVAEKADIYSYGIILWEIATGETPNRGTIRHVKVPEEAPAEFAALIDSCTQSDPENRPSAKQVVDELRRLMVQHPVGQLPASPATPPPPPPRVATAPKQDSRRTSLGGPPLPLQSREARASAPIPQYQPQQPPPVPQRAASERNFPVDRMASAAQQALLPPRGPMGMPSGIPGMGMGMPSAALGMPSMAQSASRHSLAMGTSSASSMGMGSMMPGGGGDGTPALPPSGKQRLDRQLSELLRPGCTTEELDLKHQGLGLEAVKALAVMLVWNKSLRRLNLQGNKPEVRGVKFLARALQANTTLASLSLKDDDIGREGAAALADMLVQNGALQELFLWNTRISLEGCTALCEALHRNTTLQHLDLGGNELSVKAAECIAEMLRENTGLRILDMRNNLLTKRGVSLIAEACQQNTTLRYLYLSNNDLPFMGMSGVKAIFKARDRAVGLKVEL